MSEADERRERYAAAIKRGRSGLGLVGEWNDMADAAMAVADTELAPIYEAAGWGIGRVVQENARLRAELEAADLRAQRGMEDLMRERTTLRSTIARVHSVLDDMEVAGRTTWTYDLRAALGETEED